MKKLLLALLILCSAKSFAQPVANCSMMCVLDIQIDTANNVMEVTLFNGDTNGINYPTIQVIDNFNGDTVGNPQGLFYFFWQGQGIMLHEIPTSLDSIPVGFMATVLVTDQVWDTTCYFQYPMSCPMGVNDNITDESISIYPNPSSGIVSLNFHSEKNGIIQVEMINALGEILTLNATANSGIVELDLSNLASGVYVARVVDGDKIYSQRIILE